MKREPFIWEGNEHFTGQDLKETIQLIGSDEEAFDFMLAYSEVTEDAEHNVAYILGTLPPDEARELAEYFEIQPGVALEPRQWFGGNSSVGVKVAA